MRDITFLENQARAHGEMIGRLAELVLDSPLPWTRMRRVYKLLGLVRKYGAARVEEVCALGVMSEMTSVRRLERMLQQATEAPSPAPSRVVPAARFLRPAEQYALPGGGAPEVSHGT